MKIIKELIGYSGSKVLLVKDGRTFVRKIGNIGKNLERILTLETLGLPFPKILNITNEYYDMEYIPNLDIKNFLYKHQVHSLITFIKNTVYILQKNSIAKDYSDIYNKKLSNINFDLFKFSKEQLISVLPKVLPSSQYHGDLTLENILYDVENERFVLIDPLTTDYDSYVFDLAKLRQDINCKWFIRNDNVFIEPKLYNLSKDLENEFEHYSNQYLLILMLLRVLPYTKGQDTYFIINEVNKLWK